MSVFACLGIFGNWHFRINWNNSNPCVFSCACQIPGRPTCLEYEVIKPPEYQNFLMAHPGRNYDLKLSGDLAFHFSND